jgi:hypothetical protein
VIFFCSVPDSTRVINLHHIRFNRPIMCTATPKYFLLLYFVAKFPPLRNSINIAKVSDEWLSIVYFLLSDQSTSLICQCLLSNTIDQSYLQTHKYYKLNGFYFHRQNGRNRRTVLCFNKGDLEYLRNNKSLQSAVFPITKSLR